MNVSLLNSTKILIAAYTQNDGTIFFILITIEPVMPDCRGVGESRIYSKRAKKSPFAGFVPQSGITA